jgi:xanthine/uracil permease
MKKIFSYVAEGLVIVVIGIGLAVFLLEWWVGCGETYINAKGERIAHECLFIGSNDK